MSRLTIQTLGTFHVERDGRAIRSFESNKVRMLLAYLAVDGGGRAHSREKLAALFWPEHANGRAPLRRALANLRRAIHDQQTDPPYLLINRQTLQINPDANIWLDVNEFNRLQSNADATAAELETAVSLFTGSFLEGLNLSGCLELEEWLLLQRESLARRLVEALASLIQVFVSQSQYTQALPHARRLVEIEPWQEQGHRQVMRLLAYTGQRGAALAQFETCRQFMADSLGVEPEQETLALAEQIRRSNLLPRTRAVPTPPTPPARPPVICRQEAW
ncbi:MAG: BTAD domain-containing putative transcriptional regulator, partial [Anaerolineae bacterium]